MGLIGRDIDTARDLRRQAAEAADPITAHALRERIVTLLSPVVANGGPPPVGVMLAEVLLELNRPGPALRAINATGPLTQSVPVLNLRTRALIGLGQIERGLAIARNVLKREPANALAAQQLRAFRHWDDAGAAPAATEDDDGRHGIAVAVGSGLGNLIHATPLIRRLSTWLGRRVDVIVAEDYPEALPILRCPDFVSDVLPLCPAVLRRPYELVLAVHAFGITRPPFAAKRVAWSRDWTAFRPGLGLHEAHFNLEAARLLLGMPYEVSDAHRPFVAHDEAPATACRVTAPLVGLHAGSKDGFWARKRWPHFAALATLLRSRGFAVASYGLPSEYVPGTLDKTGGTIPEMVARMRACTAFVANDSGVMNVANALDLPVLALFGPTDWRTRGPLGDRARSLSIAKACAPCELTSPSTFRAGLCACIAELPPELVADAFESMLRQEHAVTRRNGVPLLSAYSAPLP
jgi:ADP-heptose:LPS heptosyltransferase